MSVTKFSILTKLLSSVKNGPFSKYIFSKFMAKQDIPNYLFSLVSFPFISVALWCVVGAFRRRDRFEIKSSDLGKVKSKRTENKIYI